DAEDRAGPITERAAVQRHADRAGDVTGVVGLGRPPIHGHRPGGERAPDRRGGECRHAQHEPGRSPWDERERGSDWAFDGAHRSRIAPRTTRKTPTFTATGIARALREISIFSI